MFALHMFLHVLICEAAPVSVLWRKGAALLGLLSSLSVSKLPAAAAPTLEPTRPRGNLAAQGRVASGPKVSSRSQGQMHSPEPTRERVTCHTAADKPTVSDRGACSNRGDPIVPSSQRAEQGHRVPQPRFPEALRLLQKPPLLPLREKLLWLSFDSTRTSVAGQLFPYNSISISLALWQLRDEPRRQRKKRQRRGEGTAPGHPARAQLDPSQVQAAPYCPVFFGQFRKDFCCVP